VGAGDLQHSEIIDDQLLLRFGNSTVGLEARLRELRAFLEARNIGARGLYRAELAFEELVINVIRHAYRDREIGRYPIEVGVSVRGEAILIHVEDEGPPFNPLLVPVPAAPLRIEDSGIGGFGLPLVRFAATQMEYERVAGRNRLSVTIPGH
jgi:anti-sigma regulatory factor (Ser/Thr protein kinase)